MGPISQSYLISIMNWALRHRFIILSWAIFGIVLTITWKGIFFGDFWEHSAVIRELSTHLLNPKHPILPVETTHVFYSPYALMLAIASRVVGISSVCVLSIMALINYWLVVYSVRLFVKNTFIENYKAIAFYSLLLMVFWWGWKPWWFSSFFHLEVISNVLSYPSAFCFAITLIAVVIYQKSGENIFFAKSLLITAIAAFVFITHPITFIFLAVMLVSTALSERPLSYRQLSKALVIIGIAGSLSLLWPYFSILELIKDSSTFHHSNRFHYYGVLLKTWPALLGLCFIIFSKRDPQHNKLLIGILMLIFIYIYGYISAKYSYGRAISFIIILLQIIIAEKMSIWEQVGIKYKSKVLIPSKYVLGGVIITCLLLSAYPIARIGYWMIARPASYAEYTFLTEKVGQYDVVLTDIKSGWFVPSFGGKVVAGGHPLAFIKDHLERRDDVKAFFKPDATDAPRREIISKYKVDYILLHKVNQPQWRDLLQSLQSFGKVIYESGKCVLIKLNKPMGRKHARMRPIKDGSPDFPLS